MTTEFADFVATQDARNQIQSKDPQVLPDVDCLLLDMESKHPNSDYKFLSKKVVDVSITKL